jgi:glyoxylase-like metal-dependent hydrolase (beta-lactamase superfamily II)
VNLLQRYCKNGSEVFPVIVPSRFGLKTINFFLVKTGKSLSLIDAGLNNDSCLEALCRTLNENGLDIGDITQIIITHHHYDHAGLVNTIVSKNNVPVYASAEAIPRLKRDTIFMEMRVEFYARLYKEMGCGKLGEYQVAYLKNSLIKNKDQAIQTDIHEITGNMLLHFESIEMPGHAPDQLAFWDEDRGWLFSGDLLLEHISSNALVEPDFSGKRIHTLAQQENSLKNCLTLDAEIVFPGHGIIIDSPKSLIETRLERIEAKANKFHQLLEKGPATANDLAEIYYTKIYHEQFSLVMSEVISHLDYLEDQERVVKDCCNGIWTYSPV